MWSGFATFLGLIAEFSGFGMSTSAPGSIVVAATKWRQHVAVDVSPQNRFALRIKPRSGDRKDRCRHFVAFEVWAVIFCGLTSTASAPVKAIELSGVSPDREIRYRPVANGNCVFNRKGGKQLTAKEQSVT